MQEKPPSLADLFKMIAEDKITHMWAASATTIKLDAPSAVGFAPNTPSAIIDIAQDAL